MAMENPSDALEPILRFDYFVVRLSRSVSPQARVFGLVERVGRVRSAGSIPVNNFCGW